MGYQISILLTNRQIYREAWGIFQLENFWTIVRVNKAGFAKELKDRNFPIATFPTNRLSRHVRYPVMKVTVVFPNSEDQTQSDCFVVATPHLRPLMRALWTAEGASNMLVYIHVEQPRIEQSPSDRCLLRPFFKLRNIKVLLVLGVSENEYKDQLKRVVTTTDGFNQIFSELTAGIKYLQRRIKAEQWELAVAQERKHSTLLIDCQIVYGNRFTGSRAAKEIYIATATSIAEISLHYGQYARAISLTNYGLRLISSFSVFQNVNPVHPVVFVPPYHQLLSPIGISTSENEIKCDIFLIRARALMGMQRLERAFRDIKKAREVMPNSVTLASVSEAWKVMYCSFHSFHYDSSAGVIDNMDV